MARNYLIQKYYTMDIISNPILVNQTLQTPSSCSSDLPSGRCQKDASKGPLHSIYFPVADFQQSVNYIWIDTIEIAISIHSSEYLPEINDETGCKSARIAVTCWVIWKIL